MNPSARQVAEDATFQAFASCYVREVDGGRWHDGATWCQQHSMQGLLCGSQLLELVLPTQHASLVMDVTYRSLMGRHRMTTVWIQNSGQARWTPVEPFTAVTLLMREMYAAQPQLTESMKVKELELFYRLVESYQLMGRYIDERQQDIALQGDHFIESEQSLLFGHWFHPTPKSRQGMLEWQQGDYAPELGGRFQLHYFAVDAAYIEQDSLLSRNASQLVKAALLKPADAKEFKEASPTDGAHFDLVQAHEVLFPMHPLQAQWLLHQDWVVAAKEAGWLRDLGRLGVEFAATSSVRTLYSDDCAWMLKFSIPVKITNSLRVNQLSELHAGVVAARLIQNSGFLNRWLRFSVLMDPAYMTVRVPEALAQQVGHQGEESGFEMVVRSNPFIGSNGVGVHSIAAIMQDPLPGHRSRLRSLIEGLALSESRSVAEVSRDWFRHYWGCGPEVLLRLYDELGIALEAHQQNSLLDVSSGYPRRYFYRDNQGFYLANSQRDALLALEPSVANSPELFYDEAMICDRFGYYLVLNQLAAVIHRFGADGLLPETELIAFVQARLLDLSNQFAGVGKQMVDRLLQAESLPYKGNLLTRLHDVDELTADLEQAVYTRLDNPLCLHHASTAVAAKTATTQTEARHDVTAIR